MEKFRVQVFFVLIFLLILPASLLAQQIYLNEIVSSNGGGITDEDGDNSDWIELYNGGTQSVNLNNYGLSDDSDRPFRWAFPSVTLEPDEFLLIYASGKDRNSVTGELHTNFQINQQGEEILLTNQTGVTVDAIAPTNIPTDNSFGRQPDGSADWYFFESPTPGESNTTTGFKELLSPPSFSAEGGFYNVSFNLTLSTGHPGAEIRYTLDGSVPDTTSRLYQNTILIENRTDEPNNLSTIRTTPPEGEDNGFGWFEPEDNVFKGTVVRAKVFKDGGRPSETITKSYFVHPSGADRYNFPVVSIVTDSVNLFGYEEGIYIPGKIYDDNGFGDDFFGTPNANYFQRGDAWERPASFELFNNQGQLEHHQDLGIRIHGGGSRAAPMKSLRLYARNEYGDSHINHQIFPQLPFDQYDRLILRNSGQDFFVLPSMYHDAFIHRLIRDLNFDTMAQRPTITFVNGEFWGIMNIRERYDEDYIGRTYDVNENNIDYLENNLVVKQGTDDHYTSMLAYMESNSMADSAHYEEVKTRMDVDSYTDYVIAMTFVANSDWPGNNTDYWRLRTEYNPDAPTGHDGRWRWMFYDTDYSFGDNTGQYEDNLIEQITDPDGPSYPNPPWSTFLIRNLLKNQDYKNKFLNRYAGILNSTFQPSHILSILDEFETATGQVIEEHINRWGHPEEVSYWDFNVNRMREFAENRREYSFKHLMDHFGIEDTVQIELDVSSPNQGEIKINRLIVNDSTKGVTGDTYPWTGTYFQDVPVKLEAKPKPGFQFSHWEGLKDSTKAQKPVITESYSESQSITAVFENQFLALDPVPVSREYYYFTDWSPEEEPGTFPASMAFVYMEDPEPGLDSPVQGFVSGAYNLDFRTRIMGLGENGFSFLNTENLEGNPGYPGNRLGGAVLAIDTRNADDVMVKWKAGTIEPNSRVYNLRLQIRVGTKGTFQDLLDADGNPVEYIRHNQEGHTQEIDPVILPDSLEGKSNVQLLWRYYYTGVREDQNSGQRTQLNISEIEVGMAEHEEQKNTVTLRQNYPNPFNPSTVISYKVPEASHVKVEIFNITGRLIKVLVNEEVSAGNHEVMFNANRLSSGIYFYRISTENHNTTKKMVLIK